MDVNLVTGDVVDAGMAVHSFLGPGLLESAYQACLEHELRMRGRQVQTQVPLVYRGVRLDVGYRMDMIVDSIVLIELKAVQEMLPLFDAQLLAYLKLSNLPVGLLLNFNVTHFKDGIKRMVI